MGIDDQKEYTVGMVKYLDGSNKDFTIRHRTFFAESEGKAIRMAQASTWKNPYDEYYIVNEGEDNE